MQCDTFIESLVRRPKKMPDKIFFKHKPVSVKLSGTLINQF